MTASHIAGDRYRATIYIGRDRNGKVLQRSRSFRAPNQRAADKRAEAVRTELRAAAAGLALEAGTFAAYLAGWLDSHEHDRSPTTIKGYRSMGKKLVAAFGKMPLGKIGAQDVRLWHAKLAKGGMSPATIDHHHALLSAVLRQAVRDDLIPKAATFGAPRPKAVHKDIKLPRDADVLDLVNACDADLAVAIRIAASCGLRRGELVALRWSDITGRVLHVERAMIEADGMQEKSTKGKRERKVALDYHTLRVLAAHRRGQVEQAQQLGVVLAVRTDRRIMANIELDASGQTAYSPSWLSHGWERARGGSKMRLHDLRHWYAMKILGSGQATIAELSAWLGHAQVSTTLNIYTTSDPERGRVSSRVMGSLLGPARKRA